MIIKIIHQKLELIMFENLKFCTSGLPDVELYDRLKSVIL